MFNRITGNFNIWLQQATADFVALAIILGRCLVPLYILSNIMRTQEYFHGVSVVWLIQVSKVRDLWASIESRPIFRPDMRRHIRRGRGPGYELAVSFLGVGDHAATIRDISGGGGEGSTVTSLVTLSLCRSSQSIASLNCLTTCLSNTLPIVCLDTLSNLTILQGVSRLVSVL